MLDASKQKIQDLICKIGHSQGLDIQDDTELLISGVLDSLDVIRVASAIEQSLNFEVPPVDITIENFESINAIYRYMVSRMESQ